MLARHTCIVIYRTSWDIQEFHHFACELYYSFRTIGPNNHLRDVNRKYNVTMDSVSQGWVNLSPVFFSLFVYILANLHH